MVMVVADEESFVGFAIKGELPVLYHTIVPDAKGVDRNIDLVLRWHGRCSGSFLVAEHFP